MCMSFVGKFTAPNPFGLFVALGFELVVSGRLDILCVENRQLLS
jgi:hypothetical protein